LFMFFTITLYLSLAIFIIGTVYRIWTWFKIRVGPDATNFSVRERMSAALKGLIKTLFSRRFFLLLKVLILDVILQVQILKNNFVRWLMHICIFGGFMLLLLMHALDGPVTQTLFSDYASTLNPFFFLRNLFGAMVVLGLSIAVYRRITLKGLRLTTNTVDIYAIVILTVIMISGFLLESMQIISAPIFDEMVMDYADLEDPEEIKPLKIYWAEEYGVCFPDVPDSPSPELFEEGEQLHDESCVDCHSRPDWAFISYPLSRGIKPLAWIINKARADVWLWYVHFLACFIGLAYLPFSKFFHIISSPISLMVNSVTDKIVTDPANMATRRAMELDACTHCGTCTLHCSVAPVFRNMLNSNIFPSEKIISIKALVAGKEVAPEVLQSFQEGSFICTSCYRCTTLCPVGINLQDIWFSSREDLVARGLPEPHVWAKEAGLTKWAAIIKDYDTPLIPDSKHLNLSSQADTFSACFECQTCTNVCPVVANYENPAEVLDMTPHQIMHSLGLGLTGIALGSRMIWDCVTCYLCQEHCPQKVRVADILYELKNLAYGRLRSAEPQDKTEKNADETQVGVT
ncbi:MAG: 4Fe-4S dicluster domain-containing protein, partial [Deltaproteobacteria bacterium]|nr:4Fe-4S dicluster domain-containing protein [Deltaproteobacteria bacterium]